MGWRNVKAKLSNTDVEHMHLCQLKARLQTLEALLWFGSCDCPISLICGLNILPHLGKDPVIFVTGVLKVKS